MGRSVLANYAIFYDPKLLRSSIRMESQELLSVFDARQRLLSGVNVLDSETVKTESALGRVLAEDILAPDNIPPFASSSMDGYAVRAIEVAAAAAESGVALPVTADIPAGFGIPQPLSEGSAARIMTGAPLPAGADAVVPIEMTDDPGGRAETQAPQSVSVLSSVESGDYVRLAGQDMRCGQQVLTGGDFLRPQEIGVLAAVGRSRVRVVRQPRVSILSTGDELVEVGASLGPGQIRDANSFILSSLVRRYGGVPTVLGIARDRTEDVETILDRALESGTDWLLSSGGVSVGAFDCVKTVVERYGELKFWRVNMRPGKPLAFGNYRGTPFLGMPGNPVSAMVSFEVFARPALKKLCGRRNLDKPSVQVMVKDEFTSDGRESYLRVLIRREEDGFVAHNVGSQDSGILTSLVRANALLIVPAGETHVAAGRCMTAWMLDWVQD